MEQETGRCTIQPSIAFLVVTLTFTAMATATLCASILSDNWEYVTWNREKLKALEKDVAVNESTGTVLYQLEWILDGQVARVVLEPKTVPQNSMVKVPGPEKVVDHGEDNQNLPALFFVPIRGGIWTFCISLTGEQHRQLDSFGFPRLPCVNYLRSDESRNRIKTDRHHRMQNLSISCAIVCLILLGSSALIGVFGITKHQISAVLVTGVMYLLAAIFATFSLTIINFKRSQGRTDCFNRSTTHELTAEGVIVSNVAMEKPYSLKRVNKYFEARIFSVGWSLHMGWAGAGMCILVSILWILLSKIMRYNPLNTLLTIL